MRWVNDDDAIHSVKGDGDLEYESADLSQDDAFEQTFDEPGEQPYVCGKHSCMKGTVTVGWDPRRPTSGRRRSPSGR